MTGAELERLGPAELRELQDAWMERERRLDWRAGVVASIMANAHRDSESCPAPFHPADFFASLDTARPEPTEEELMLKALGAFGLAGG